MSEWFLSYGGELIVILSPLVMRFLLPLVTVPNTCIQNLLSNVSANVGQILSIEGVLGEEVFYFVDVHIPTLIGGSSSASISVYKLIL